MVDAFDGAFHEPTPTPLASPTPVQAPTTPVELTQEDAERSLTLAELMTLGEQPCPTPATGPVSSRSISPSGSDSSIFAARRPVQAPPPTRAQSDLTLAVFEL